MLTNVCAIPVYIYIQFVNASGVIRVAEPLDHELSREYFLTLMAKDNGISPLSNTAIVNINITDVNDNAPQFGQLTYSTTIREDAEEGTQLIHVMLYTI